MRNVAAVATLAGLAACGGSGGDGDGGSDTPPPPPAGTGISRADASRFLAQASMGATADQIARVQAVGYEGWLDEQFAMPPTTSRWDWMVSKLFDAAAYKNTDSGFDPAAWRKLVASADTLRQRVTLALSELAVVGLDGLVGGGWRAFSGAAYLDLLEANAFGNYRTLLQQISASAPMGEYLTFRGNRKANATTGAMPDENYARELMQLFTIGLVRLEPDGTPTLVAGKPQETYTQDDITGLARVFTGWDYDLAGADTSTPAFKQRPMAQVAGRHETGAKTFLGTTIPAGTDGARSLQLALDAIYAHPNVAPFVGRQLVQRLVCSNPSPAYVRRVAAVFDNDGSGIKGNLRAVLKAILLDEEARGSTSLADARFGKLREPVLRFTAWARAFDATSPGDTWAIGNTSDPATRLGQSPLRSPSVFNFFRPGYVPPGSAIADASLVAPEFQITNESTVVGYLNFMQRLIGSGIGDVKADTRAWLPRADDVPALVEELNVVLAAGRLASGTQQTIRDAVGGMPGGTDAARQNRVNAAVLLVLASPEFIVQK